MHSIPKYRNLSAYSRTTFRFWKFCHTLADFAKTSIKVRSFVRTSFEQLPPVSIFRRANKVQPPPPSSLMNLTLVNSSIIQNTCLVIFFALLCVFNFFLFSSTEMNARVATFPRKLAVGSHDALQLKVLDGEDRIDTTPRYAKFV